MKLAVRIEHKNEQILEVPFDTFGEAAVVKVAKKIGSPFFPFIVAEPGTGNYCRVEQNEKFGWELSFDSENNWKEVTEAEYTSHLKEIGETWMEKSTSSHGRTAYKRVRNGVIFAMMEILDTRDRYYIRR